ncbi:MAG: CorA family divalent cation transporter [Xanthomonadaceae bacterium]|nr:CorA family divalent cation transporter [Xanthomonadaceae bacterium]MDZ4379127.1 CorA family divalent cation transporter [Xanthomonadaceae bacterium]
MSRAVSGNFGFLGVPRCVGIYGMNFAYIPELAVQWGYFAVLGVMITIAVTLLVMFKRKHWI